MMYREGRSYRLSATVLSAAVLLSLAGIGAHAASTAPFDQRGEAIYSANCAGCHEGQVERAPSGRRAFMSMPQSQIYRALTTGTMKAMAAGLSDEEKRSVTSYLTRRPYSVEPEAAVRPPVRCAANPKWFDYAQRPTASGWGIRSQDNTRFIDATTAGLTPESVKRLKLKWAFALPNSVVVRSQPAIAGGAVYIGGQDGDVYALDAKTGCMHWHAKVDQAVRTSMAIDDWGSSKEPPSLYFGGSSGATYALDATTGASRWVRQMPQTMITGGATLFEGRLYVPLIGTPRVSTTETGPCCTGRGSVAALDAKTGRVIWQSYAINTPPKPYGRNPKGVPLLGPSGAGIWSSPTIDKARNRLYVGTGENDSLPVENGGAVLAMDLPTGKILWSFQNYVDEAYNSYCRTGLASAPGCPSNFKQRTALDISSSPMLIQSADGSDYLVAIQKSGDVFRLDPDTGKMIWRRRITRGDYNIASIFGMAADGERIFAGVMDLRRNAAQDGKYWGSEELGIYSLNAKTGEPAWFAPVTGQCRAGLVCRGYSAAFTALPGILFAIGIDGWLRALSTESGDLLWDFDAGREFKTVNGELAKGGDIEGPGIVASGGMIFVNSGYGTGNAAQRGGNAFLAFSIE